MAAEDSISYYEIDSSSKRDSWLHSVMQSMSLEQLDVFFSAVSKLVYGPKSSRSVPLSSLYTIVRNSIFLQTNRIERRLKIVFQCITSKPHAKSDLRDFVCSLMFLVYDGRKKKLLESYKLHRGADKLPSATRKECERTRVCLMGNSIVIEATEKMFGRRWKIFRKIRWFYYRRLADESWPMLSLLAFGLVSVVLLFLVFPLCH